MVGTRLNELAEVEPKAQIGVRRLSCSVGSIKKWVSKLHKIAIEASLFNSFLAVTLLNGVIYSL